MKTKKTGEISLKPRNAKEENSTIQKQPVRQEQKKATYEELNNYCIQLYNQNKTLIEQVKQKDFYNLFKRLDYLFQVLRYKDCFDKDFVTSCTLEVQTALTPSEATETTEQ